jgi:HlyD family secretion protein
MSNNEEFKEIAEAEERARIGEPLVPLRLPATIPVPAKPTRRHSWIKAALAVLALLAVGATTHYWWNQLTTRLPPGIAWGNGRIEADTFDISTKFAGRIAELRAQEGDLVSAGQVLARMDTSDLEASLGRAEAQVRQSQQALQSARADAEQQSSQLKLADQQLQRARALLRNGNISREIVDERQAQWDGSAAAYNSAVARIAQAEHALEAAKQDVALRKVNIADNTLLAPRDGRLQYRLANQGEVLGAGGKVFTMLDVGSVYMDVFLPTSEAGRVVVGSDARILLDAFPDRPIPAQVAFIDPEAQFTPKAVETQSERDKLMFRIRVRIDPALLRRHAEKVRSGLPGVAYLRVDPKVEWPTQLQPKASG